MDVLPEPPAPVALVVMRPGILLALAPGEEADAALLWRAQTGQTQLGRRLLRLARGEETAQADLAFGRGFARAVLRAVAAAPDVEAMRVEPAAGELAAWALAADTVPALHGAREHVLAAAWREVAAAVATELHYGELPQAEYLQRHGVDPEVGRLYFHLAERTGDERRPFGFMATMASVRGADGRALHVPLAAAVSERGGDRAAQRRLLAPLDRAARRDATVRALVASHEVFHAVAWTAAEAHALLQATPALEACGIRVRAPAWAQAAAVRPQVEVAVGSGAPGSLGLGALLDFKLKYFIGDDELTAEEWAGLVRGAAGLHRLRGRWVALDPARHAELLRQWEAAEALARRGEVGFVEGVRMLAGLAREGAAERVPAWTVVRPGPWLARTLADLQDPRGSAEADPGPALHGVLRPYQRDGVAWLWLLSRLGIGGCLADDMGLGKTIQVIALLLLLRRHGVAGPNLIVLPASLLGNWRAELARFGPDLRVHAAHRGAGDGDAAPDLATVDVVLTTYATLLRMPWAQAQAWGLVVLDEAQAIKNPGTQQTHAVKRLRSRHRLILTGTPVENSLADLWSLFDFSNPGLLGGAAEFKAFCRRLGREHDGMQPLRALVRPYLLRRLKTDRRVIADLPDKSELQVYCGLTRVQAALYAKAVESLAREVAEATGMRRRGLILTYLMRFKQICNHPSHYSGDGKWVARDSAKFMRLAELCGPIAEAGEKLLVFTQFREMCQPLADALARSFGRAGLVLHGGTPVVRRAALVAEFQADAGPPFMVLSLKAGGTGLNLTAAAHVVHFDRWWNPAVENQATDRAYRIGQHKNVLVHKFVCRGTLEERIDAMLRGKQGLADGVLADAGEPRLTELDTPELLRIVSLDLRAALSED
jgi:hypothetical protein